MTAAAENRDSRVPRSSMSAGGDRSKTNGGTDSPAIARGPLRLVEANVLGQLSREHARAEHMIHRLPEREVSRQRHRRDELGEPNLGSIGGAHREDSAVDKLAASAVAAVSTSAAVVS